MSPTSPPINPSLAVERIREIIVGRHLERLEQRIIRLETQDTKAHAASPMEERLLATEARLEAVEDHSRRLADRQREDIDLRDRTHREEVRRLAIQIQQIAASRQDHPDSPAVAQLEHKLGIWLTRWKESLQEHLDARDSQLAANINQELTQLRQWLEARITASEAKTARTPDLTLRFKQIAAAARALADSFALPTDATTTQPR